MQTVGTDLCGRSGNLNLMRCVGAWFVVFAVSGAALAAVTAASASKTSLDAATDAWERGEFITALSGFLQVMNAPGADAFLEPIALTTGELFETRELTPDGRAPRFSLDNQFIADETGLETSRRTRDLRNDPSAGSGQAPTLVADLPGVSATFSSTLNQVAYLRIPDANDEIRRASDAIAQESLTAQNRGQLTQALAWLIAKHADIVMGEPRHRRSYLYAIRGQTGVRLGSDPIPTPTRILSRAGQSALPSGERSTRVRKPSADHRDEQDHGGDGDAAGVESVAADEPEGGLDPEPRARRRVVPRRVRSSGGSAAASADVTQPRVTLPRIAALTVVSVKAVNARGLEGWDWARTTVGETNVTRITQ